MTIERRVGEVVDFGMPAPLGWRLAGHPGDESNVRPAP